MSLPALIYRPTVDMHVPNSKVEILGYRRMFSVMFHAVTIVIATAIGPSLAQSQFAYTSLINFDGNVGGVKNPTGGLVSGSDGALYGTSQAGGDGNGTIFKMSDGLTNVVILHKFSPTNTNAVSPVGRLLYASDGMLYGAAHSASSLNTGALFKIGTDGSNFVILHYFGTAPSDGRRSLGGLIEGSDGKLYGTTHSGGLEGVGTAFRINRDGTDYATLHHFTGAGDGGVRPNSDLFQGSDGFLYGTTQFTSRDDDFKGVVFKLDKDGTNYSVLHRFGVTIDDGNWPLTSVVECTDGELYGITVHGGGSDQSGTVYRVDKDGSNYSVIWRFALNSVDGFGPATLTEGSDGLLYGVAGSWSTDSNGLLFRLLKDGSRYSVIHRSDLPDATSLSGPLLEGQNCAFYGTGIEGGQFGMGAVFRFEVAPELFSKRIPTGFQIQFYGSRGKSYDILRAEDIEGPWLNIATRIAPTDNLIEYVDLNPLSRAGFYRVRRSP